MTGPDRTEDLRSEDRPGLGRDRPREEPGLYQDNTKPMDTYQQTYRSKIAKTMQTHLQNRQGLQRQARTVQQGLCNTSSKREIVSSKNMTW